MTGLVALGWSERGPQARVTLQPDAVQNGVEEWGPLADSMQHRLHAGFWNASTGHYMANDAGKQRFHYWWNAHALGVLVDGYLRSGNAMYADRMRALHEGIWANSDSTWTNDYYDDMAWLALASLRAYRATNEPRYLEATRALWEEIKTGWNDRQGGGIAWRTSQPGYKNTPANAPSAILAARLYRQFGNPADRRWAKRIYSWLTDHLVDPSTGLVWDGVNRQGKGEIDRDWVFTYNQGTYIGAALALYKMSGEAHYLEDARRTANYVLESETLAPGGVLTAEGTGDGGLFKGILVRYLARLARCDDVGTKHRRAYRSFLRTNAQVLRKKGLRRPSLRAGPDWREAPRGPVDLSVQMSGLMLIEAVARLSR